MKRRTMLLLASSAMELVLLLPVIALLDAYTFPMKPLWIVPVAIASMAGVLAGEALNIWWKRLLFLTGTGTVLVFGAAAAQWGAATALAFGAIGIAAALQGMTAGRRAGAPLYYWLALTTFMAAGLLYPALDRLRPYVPAVGTAALFSFVVCLFVMNGTHLRMTANGGGTGQTVLPTVRSYNRLFMSLFAIGTVLASLLLGGVIAQGIGAVLGGVLRFLFRSKESTELLPPQVESQPPASPKLEGGEPSWIAQFLEKVFFVAVIVLLLVLAGYAGYKLLSRMPRAIRSCLQRLIRWLKGGVDARPSYVYDEETSVFRLEEALAHLQKDGLDRFRRAFGRADRQPTYHRLSNRDKARFSYRLWLQQLLKRGGAVQPHLTARETLRLHAQTAEAAQAAAIYEKARYSIHPVEDEETAAMESFRSLEARRKSGYS